MSSALREQSCKACEGGVPALTDAELQQNLLQISSQWQLNNEEPKTLQARYCFRNYYQTMAFVNALAWVAHQENHHPDVSFSYRECTVKWTTHAIHGLSLNDFICAAKTDALVEKQP
ncbi:MAG: 4a-hydroxytetrahydrobiopterin dehydratase [Oceanococcus sp.]